MLSDGDKGQKDSATADRPIDSYDLDHGYLADALEDMAAGIRNGEIYVQEVESGRKASQADAVAFELRLQYIAEWNRTQAANPTLFDPDGGSG